MLRAGGPPRPSGTPPEGGELGRGREFARGRRNCVGEELGLSRIRSGLGKSDFLDNNGLPLTVRSRKIGSHGKSGDPGKNNPHTVSGSPEPPPPGGGRGRSRTGLPSEEKIPGKKMHLPGWSRTQLPSEEKMTGKTTALPRTHPRQNPRNPLSKINK